MARTSDFISTVAAIFSHSHMIPTPLPVSLSSASLPDTRPTSSQSSSSSILSRTSSKRSKKSKKLSEKMKLHNDVWWTTTAQQPIRQQTIVIHEWSYMYL